MTEPSGSASRLPNIVVIVLDCARAASFPETGGLPGSFPSLERLKSESTVFTHASTVAPWTLPSHGSIFTGRYPWDHGVMGAGRLRLDTSLPTVESLLRQQGYRTLALSANGLLAPLVGRSGSFETYRCAQWWEKTLRWIPPESLGSKAVDRSLGARTLLSILASGTPPRRSRASASAFLTGLESPASLRQAVRAADPRQVPLGPFAEAASWGMVDLLSRVARALRSPGDPHPLPVAPWVESTLSERLAQQPSSRPVHCFINLLDLHEKYLSDAAVVPDFATWTRFARLAQNSRLWLQGRWQPSASDLDLLRRLYEAVMVGLDRRMRRLIEILELAGRWENTLLVVTSDHGQSFGDHGQVFHEQSPYESLLHVPLWIRWPYGEGGGRRISERTSLVDIAPTLLRAAGVEVPDQLPGVSLQGDALPARTEPVLAMADGYPSVEVYSEGLPPAAAARLKAVNVVAYAGDFKAILETRSGAVHLFNLAEDPDERVDLTGDASGPASTAVHAARQAAERVGRASDGISDPALHDRLRSWGYL